MLSNADIVREACRVVRTEGQVDRVSEFYQMISRLIMLSRTGERSRGGQSAAANVRVGFLTT